MRESPPVWGECLVCECPIGAEPLPGGFVVWTTWVGYFTCAAHLARVRFLTTPMLYIEAV